MRTAQRGSVLLTAIAGILILAVIGTVMVSLMTSSVMTAVDGKETLQATYLAESGKEIARARTAKLSGGALMSEAEKLENENEGKGFAVGDKGFVKLNLYPSWFRWYGGKLNTTSSGWFPPKPAAKIDKIELLVISKNGAKLYAYDAGGNTFGMDKSPPATEAGDVYLLGRVEGADAIRYDNGARSLTVSPQLFTRDFDFFCDFDLFPESGGLIGLVDKHAPGTLPIDAQVSNLRFTYDRKMKENGTYTFTNLTPLSDTSVSQDDFKNKDIVLGQYFRVVCEATTANGARAALVWHTNGRNSLRFGEGEGTGSEEGVVGGSNAKDLVEIFGGKVGDGKKGEIVTGENILGKLEAEDYYDKDDDDDELEWDFDDIEGSNKNKIEINHFLKMGNKGGNQEYWSVAVATPWLAYKEGKDPSLKSILQYSFEADDDENYFTGILCRLGFWDAADIVGSSGSIRAGSIRAGYGARGIGVGILQGEIHFEDDEKVKGQDKKEKVKVKTSSINPALLPGFEYDGHDFVISRLTRDYYYGSVDNRDGAFAMVMSDHGRGLHPLIIVWAYDDLQNGAEVGTLKTLRPLAVAPIKNKEEHLTLKVKIEEKENKNYLNIWWKSGKHTKPDWPTDNHTLVSEWKYLAPDISEADEGKTLIVPWAVGENYRRVGIFSEAYAFKNMNKKHSDIEIEGFFFTGTDAGAGELSPGGLTPGITN